MCFPERMSFPSITLLMPRTPVNTMNHACRAGMEMPREHAYASIRACPPSSFTLSLEEASESFSTQEPQTATSSYMK